MSKDSPHQINYPPVALVTGAGVRIGRQISLALAEASYAVAIHYRNSEEPAQSLAEEIRALGGTAACFKADLANEEEIQQLVPRVTAEMGPLGVLINNASTFELDLAETTTRKSWDFHMETNLRAPFVLSQALVAQLPENTHGAILNMLDQRVWNLTPYFTSYSLSKAGLWTLTQTLAMALAPRVRVNAIGPGPALPSPFQTDEQFQRQEAVMPLKRGTTPEEIARTTLFLLSAPAITGQMLALDGGQHLGWAQPGVPSALADS